MNDRERLAHDLISAMLICEHQLESPEMKPFSLDAAHKFADSVMSDDDSKTERALALADILLLYGWRIPRPLSDTSFREGVTAAINHIVNRWRCLADQVEIGDRTPEVTELFHIVADATELLTPEDVFRTHMAQGSTSKPILDHSSEGGAGTTI